MDHAYFRDRVSAFHDRELPAQEMVIVEEHIRDCAECQGLLAELVKIDALVAKRAELAGGDYWDRSARQIEERLGFVRKAEITSVKKARWERGLAVKISAIAASLALLVFIGINRDKILRQDQVTPNYKPPTEVPAVVPADSLREDTLSGIIKQPEDRVQVQSKDQAQPQSSQSKQPGRTDKPATDISTQPAPRQPQVPSSENYIAEKAAPDTFRPAPPAQQSDELTTQAVPEEENDVRVQPLPVEPGVKKEQLASGATRQAASEAATKRKTVRTLTDTAERSNDRQAPAQAQQSLRESVAAEQEVTPTVGSEKELAMWRSKQDSLKDRLHTNETALLNKYPITSLIKRAASPSKLAPRLPLVPSASDRAAIEKGYLEACYHVALLTPTADEYASAKAELDKAAAQRTSANSGVAQRYLDELQANRPSPPQN